VKVGENEFRPKGLQFIGPELHMLQTNMDFSGTYYPVDAHYSYGPADNNRAHASYGEVVVRVGEVTVRQRPASYGAALSKPMEFCFWAAGRAEWCGLTLGPPGLPFTPKLSRHVIPNIAK